MPKVGKTDILTKLPSCLILDAEKGAETGTNTRIPITSISGATKWLEPEPADGPKLLYTSIDQVYTDICADGAAQAAAKQRVQFPYRRIALDTIDKIEDMCEITATEKYKKTTIGKSFNENSVLELPNGGGYYHLRNEVILKINTMASVCETLIIISHIKEKLLNKGGIDVSSTDISLTGKLGGMVCALADAIGYLYRDGNKLMVSFETNNNAIMGARFARLAGQRFEMDWSKIFLDEAEIVS